MKTMRNTLLQRIIMNFADNVTSGELLRLPEDILYEVLASENLCVASEDTIVDVIESYYSSVTSTPICGDLLGNLRFYTLAEVDIFCTKPHL